MLGIKKEEFLRRYGASLLDGTACVFVGAGMSIPAGLADWRRLLRQIADDMNLDLEFEHDLVAVAQYEANRKGGRASLDEAIIKQFAKEAAATENHKLLARLPLTSVWTTNYDQLIEQAFRAAGKKVDVKHALGQVPYRYPDVDVTLFKMHGDVEHPADATLTKDDYELYETTKGPFLVQLLAELLSKRFLFLGFSFTDPNIEYTFTRLRRMLNPHGGRHLAREHFCILREPNESDYADRGLDAKQLARVLKADTARFAHRIRDLTRLGLHAVVIREYGEITDLLTALHRKVSARTIMVSGAAADFDPLGADRLLKLCEELGQALIENGYDIVSGVGQGIGASVMVGAHRALANPDASRLHRRLRLFPFPYWHSDATARAAFARQNRREMAFQAGISLFIAGNKLVDGSVINSPGVLEELKAGKEAGHLPVPLGVTGHAARSIWAHVSEHQTEIFGELDVREELKALGAATSTNEQLVAAVLNMLGKIRG